jgi:predicted metal-binding membrane protein
MTGSILESVLRRDRAVVAAALAIVIATAWGLVLWFAFSMPMESSGPSMDMPGMDMPGMLAPGIMPWSMGDAVFMFIMWSVMMVGMMTPSAAPMILIYAGVGRHALQQGKPFASTGWFAGGYLAAWVGFALVATSAQWALERLALLTPMMRSASPLFGGALLMAAGLYQWTALKERCLSHCQAPLVFIGKHGGFRGDYRGALQLGLRHGAYCIGCCWALMALLFVGGVMNILWIALLSIFVLIEKIVPAGRMISRSAGAALFILGLAMVLHIIPSVG